jgi:hypothetical protein
MKRPRHKPRPKFISAQEPVGLANELPDLYCDLPEDVRRTLPSDHARKSQVRPEYTTWLAMRPHVLGAIVSAAKVIASQGKTPTTETITELLSGCYSREVVESAWAEIKERGWEAPTRSERQPELP